MHKNHYKKYIEHITKHRIVIEVQVCNHKYDYLQKQEKYADELQKKRDQKDEIQCSDSAL